MEHISRLFNCALCLTQCVICSSCDHGNIYCSSNCARSARQKSCKESNKRYQQSKKGRMNNALRQQRFRERVKNKVTDQGSQITPQDALLVSVENRAEKSIDRQEKNRMKCCCCQMTVSDWVRYGFLQQTARANTLHSLSGHRPP